MSAKKQVTVSVVGSLNIDYFTRVDHLPAPGETVASRRLDLHRGGKGANQAISAARQGARTFLFGAVGDDAEGIAYREALEEEGIDLAHLKTSTKRTGAAFISVDDEGENMIVTAAGANGDLTENDIDRGRAVIEASGAVLANFEIPIPALIAAARIANAASVPLLVNPSPFDPTFPWDQIRTDYLVVNEGEATEVLGFSPLREEATTVRQRMTEIRIEHLVITRGGDDTLVYPRAGEMFAVETMPVLPIDTVGAGDAFAGCLASRVAAGVPLESAIRSANCAGALTTLGPGAQTPMPDRAKTERHLEHIGG